MDEYPPFTWSLTRHRTLQECPRRYYLEYYAASVGRHRNATALCRQAHRLKYLATPLLVLGTAVHQCARDLVLAIRSRRPRPLLSALISRTRTMLNDVWRRSRARDAYERAPGPNSMYRELYYGADFSPAQVRQVRSRMSSCLESLLSCPILDEVTETPASEIRLVDRPLKVRVEEVTIWIVPDLVYRAPGSPTAIVDWKTGAAHGGRLQQAVYALGLQYLGTPTPSGVLGRLVHLSRSSIEDHSITGEDLREARDTLRDSTERMWSYLEDPAANRPVPLDGFARTERTALCTRCNFQELCWEQGTVPAPPVEPAPREAALASATPPRLPVPLPPTV